MRYGIQPTEHRYSFFGYKYKEATNDREEDIEHF